MNWVVWCLAGWLGDGLGLGKILWGEWVGAMGEWAAGNWQPKQ